MNPVYEQDKDGTWISKAEPTNVKVYKERPQFDVIYEIDAHMQGQMDNEIKLAVKEILKEL